MWLLSWLCWHRAATGPCKHRGAALLGAQLLARLAERLFKGSSDPLRMLATWPHYCSRLFSLGNNVSKVGTCSKPRGTCDSVTKWRLCESSPWTKVRLIIGCGLFIDKDMNFADTPEMWLILGEACNGEITVIDHTDCCLAKLLLN